MIDRILIFKDRVILAFKEPYSFVFDPGIMKHRDDDIGVRNRPVMQVTRDSNPQPAVLETAALPVELVTYVRLLSSLKR
jgi:hypothetical protein